MRMCLFQFVNKMKVDVYQKVISSTITCLQKYTLKESIQRQSELHGILSSLAQLKFQELGLEKAANHRTGVGIRNILEKRGLRITLYYMPAGETMKLHSHPSMLVVSYMIRGRLEAKIYSPTVNAGVFERETLLLSSGAVSYIDGMRTNNRNLHEFHAIEDSYFLDILFPDYDQARECFFYEQQQQVSDRTWKLKQVIPNQIEFYEI